MADLKGIIKLRKHRLDEKRRALGQLNDQLDRLEILRKKLEEDLEDEQRAAAESEMAMLTYGNFARLVIERREQLDTAIEQLTHRIDEAREDIRLAFGELKKFEITQRERERREREEYERRETQELNEIAIEGFRRRED